MRTSKELRKKIERAAGKSGRSLCQEVEFRLEQSFLAHSLLRIVQQELHTRLDETPQPGAPS